MPLVMTVLMWTFPVDKRGTAMGLFGIVIAFGPAIAPTVAGVIIDRYTLARYVLHHHRAVGPS